MSGLTKIPARKGKAAILRTGERLRLVNTHDLVIVFSACPQDIVPINGADCVRKDVHFEIC